MKTVIPRRRSTNGVAHSAASVTATLPYIITARPVPG